MIQIRPYHPSDADTVLGWFSNEESFRKWCGSTYPHFPITAEELNRKYGEWPNPERFYPLAFFDGQGLVGHLTLHYTDEENSVMRLCFVVVDDSRRGKGIGKQMMQLALDHAFQVLKAKKVTLCVFENNPAARRCYEAVGFREADRNPPRYFDLMGTQVKLLEMEAEVS